jgi:hypothetical protein
VALDFGSGKIRTQIAGRPFFIRCDQGVEMAPPFVFYAFCAVDA